MRTFEVVLLNFAHKKIDVLGTIKARTEDEAFKWLLERMHTFAGQIKEHIGEYVRLEEE